MEFVYFHVHACICVHVYARVCWVGTSWGDVKCHTSWEAGGFDVARAPFSILIPKISPGHPISSDGVERGSGGWWETWQEPEPASLFHLGTWRPYYWLRDHWPEVWGLSQFTRQQIRGKWSKQKIGQSVKAVTKGTCVSEMGIANTQAR